MIKEQFNSHEEALKWMQENHGVAVFVEGCNVSYMIDDEEPDMVLFKDFGYDYDCFGNYISFDTFLEDEQEILYKKYEESKSGD